MKSLFSFLITIFLISLASTASAGQAAGSEEAVAAQTLSFPYVAQVIGDDVNLRSGPGTNYYLCGKLNKADVVKVVQQKYGWSCVVPPEGTFSWISKQYVEIDPTNPSVGIVSGDNVRVRAGSADNNPLHSDQVQGMFDKGDRVRLMGEEQSDYYKIYPPSFAYLWVSTQYTKPLGTAVEEAKPAEEDKEPADSGLFAPAMVPATKDLRQYYALEQIVKAEYEKPVLEQDYSTVKEALQLLAENKDADKAARYAEYMVKRIENFELAAEVSKAVQLQDQQLQQTRENIQKAYQIKLEQLSSLGRFAVIGKIQTSSVYGTEPVVKHYKILDSAGNIICYALPAGSAPEMDISRYFDKKVGLVGTIEPHPATSSALVRFTEIAEVD
jgi:SH3-like domain-containing protein